MNNEVMTLVAHAGLKGIFKDPNEEVYYITKNKVLNDHQSYFTVPALSRYFVVPDFIIKDMISRSDLDININISEDLKYYPKYRGVWWKCPSCGNSESCGSVYIKDSNVSIGHCIVSENFHFSIIKEEDFIHSTKILIEDLDEYTD